MTSLATYHATPSRGLFAWQLLLGLIAPVTDKNLVALVAWMQGENTKAHYNPLATTRPALGSTSYNTTGVRNYPSLVVGIDSTLQTLRNGHYPEVLAALRKGDNIQHVVHAVLASPWGTTEIPWEGVLANVPHYSAIPIAT